MLRFPVRALLVPLFTVEFVSGNAAAAEETKPAVTLLAEPFDLGNVRLLEGPFRDAMLREKAHLLSLGNDRLLHSFRVTAGLPSSAQPLGGWEKPDGELRGHSIGHYLSGLALMHASTGDAALKKKADDLVAELAKCQAALPAQGFHEGYLSAYPEEFFDRVDAAKKVWDPITRCTKSWPACSMCIFFARIRRRSMCSRAWPIG